MKLDQSKIEAHFGQIERKGYLPDIIASDILAKVQSGILKPGDCLPTEIMLAQRFGVSRNVVREAIARLRSDGVIATKQGRGAVIKPISERATFRVDTQNMPEENALAQLFELRAILEIDVAGIAALRRSDGDLAQLDETMNVMAESKVFDELRLQSDARFHRLLGQATGNSYLAGFVDYISGRLADTTRKTERVYGKDDLLEISVSEHLAVLEAVRAQNPTAAREAMARHVKAAAGRLGLTNPETAGVA
ncbi:FadR/GntR family transcriptional regulator [Halocynthiibacter sp. C4]|uniref:FadR/GntR family transcriptional regulator n=1 Tax=Halocynthiibacter sp. C4 TaxID=2992758 RepID=UPI00237C4CBD|nr:FadR/GntR family transcriptional regulator [Halocynthiibacter sp. C4]MDE0589189.1 FadR/GntR family transcriptional regulator [Halocynthiibacter sp. C4]